MGAKPTTETRPEKIAALTTVRFWLCPAENSAAFRLSEGLSGCLISCSWLLLRIFLSWRVFPAAVQAFQPIYSLGSSEGGWLSAAHVSELQS
ncbi:hypothetical protein PAPYR_8791 [Paratrimastix pyriformis]|uniref:Uncharacterized protein n=1 Tax=Paratrimastix pyriformis TaxID=342808 RepID=A0ABQ8U9W7_9EUKA|nr:hypothetical protein PAPYR_8791 [Paratrimastix pyriformis]